LRALQVRNGPRDTFDPSHRVRKRRSGFLARIRTRTGRATLKRRKHKGRKSLSH
ncbi:ribosomal protein L34, partial [Trichophaea hybrida]